MPGFTRKLQSRSARRRSAPPSIAAVETLEDRILLSASPIGGVGNNLLHPEWGSAGVDLLRTADAEYADGVSSPAGADRPSARVVSNSVSDQSGQDIISDRLMSAMIYAWGQFIDHDFDLTLTGGSEPLSIAVPTGDPWFDPAGTGTQSINTTRSVFDPETGTGADNPRQQVNAITAFIDGSMIYGSDAAKAASLRTFAGGKLNTSDGNLLPTDASGSFVAGDIRVNENVELIALQTLFVREHNSWADKFASQNKNLSDEQLYQKARERVIFEIQSITYNEWLPALMGNGALDAYRGYEATVNPGIANEFSTAAFRFGHSLLGDDVEFLNNNGLEVREGVALSEAFFNPNLVKETGIDPILKYLASDPSSEVDTKVVDSVRNFLFGPPGAGGLDLASLNIARGRDHGLADYNTVREAYGLPRVSSFAEITSNVELQGKLQELYGTVDNIDLWVGGLAEDHVAGGSVGETLRAVISDQFERLRDGDRFFYLNQLQGKELREVQQTTLADVIARNTTVNNLQRDVFFFNSTISGSVFNDANGNGKLDGRDPRAAGVEVRLLDASTKEVMATTLTDAKGVYQFNVANGLRTGEYQVAVVLDDGSLGPTTTKIAITRGDQFLTAADLALGSSTRPGHGPGANCLPDTNAPGSPGANGSSHVDLARVGPQESRSGGAAHQNGNKAKDAAPAQQFAQNGGRRRDAVFAASAMRGLMSDLT